MKKFKRFLMTACDILVLMGAAGLVLSPSIYGKNSPLQAKEDDSPGRGDEHRADLCDRLPDPRGKAEGIKKRCLRGGSSSGVAKGDFNGDGFGDLAIGVPDEDTGGAVDAGAVIVIYGSANGLTSTDPTVPASRSWGQKSPGVPGTPEDGDRFGSSLAAGDFNGDGFSDLAIGVPGEDITLTITNGGSFTYPDAGAVVVIYGSATGLTTSDTSVPHAKFFSYGVFGAAGITGNERLGSSLAWGDFNDDGVGDLAMGAPGVNVIPSGGGSSLSESGEVWVLYGGADGLSRKGEQLWNENRLASCEFSFCPTIIGAQAGDHFGAALTAGDFNGDEATDLAVGVPDYNLGGTLPGSLANSGGVGVFYGDTGQGLFQNSATQFLTQSPSFSPAADDHYGSVLAAGDFNGDGRADLAIGVPLRDLGAATKNAGVVHVRYGHADGILEGPDLQVWSQNTLFPGDSINRSEADDGFGFSLAAGDFNGDGKADLAIGVPFESIISFRTGTATNVSLAGEVDVVYGSSSGLSITARKPQIWSQDEINIQDIAEPADLFGYSLTAWNFGKGPQADLAIGVPFEDLQSGPPPGTLIHDAGGVNVIYGSPPGSTLDAANGLTSLGDQFWTQASVGASNEKDDHFGLALY